MTTSKYASLVRECQRFLLKHYAGNEAAEWAILWMRLPRLLAWRARIRAKEAGGKRG
jgi:hypothetical protein